MRQFIDFEWKSAEGPYISVIFPHQIHMLQLSEDAETDVIMFDQSVFCSALLNNELVDYNIDLQKRLNNINEIPEAEWNNIITLSDQMKVLAKDMSMIKKMEIIYLIKAVLLKLIDIAPQAYPITEIDRDLRYYQKFRDSLNKEFIAQKKVQDYAKELGISTKKLSLVSKKYTGHTPLELVHERLSLELKKMIVEDGLMLKDIAHRLDFSSQPALNKFIERQFNSTPQKWKESLEASMMGKETF